MAILVKPIYVIAGAVIAFLILTRRSNTGLTNKDPGFLDALKESLSYFIPSVEGFRSTPYWDESRYSWGYGTAAPGPSGVISREKAMVDSMSYLLNDYNALSKHITRALTVNQWTALLSFSYNVGIGQAYNLLSNINNYADVALKSQWRKYIYAGGKVNENLIERREKELSVWFS